MTRELHAVVRGKTLPGWVMICNSCWSTHSDVRDRQELLPLDEFAAAGWFIGEVTDLCPVCVAAAGGLAAVAVERPASGQMGRYVRHPEGRNTWHCLDCDRDVRARGFSRGSVAVIDDREVHDRWHERVEAERSAA